MHEDVIAVGVQAPVENEGRVHKRTWIDQTASFPQLHLLDVKHEASVEDLEGQCGFASKDQDFVFCNLIGQTHVSWDPLSFVDDTERYFLPNIS